MKSSKTNDKSQQDDVIMKRRELLLGASAVGLTAGLGASKTANAEPIDPYYIEVVGATGPIRRTHPVHIRGRGWSKIDPLGYPGSIIYSDGSSRSIELAMIKLPSNHRGWSIRDLTVFHDSGGSAIYAASGIFGHIADVNITGRSSNSYINYDKAIELYDLMAFRGERIKANEWNIYGLTDHMCRGGNHSLTDCHFSSDRPTAKACLYLNMNGWRIEGGEYNLHTAGGVCIKFERTTDWGTGSHCFIHQTRLEIVEDNTIGVVFDSLDDKPYFSGIVDSPQLVLRNSTCIGVDFQFCEACKLINPSTGHRARNDLVDGKYWRFGPKSENCVVIEDHIIPQRDVHFIDKSAEGSGNCVIYRGQVVYQS